MVFNKLFRKRRPPSPKSEEELWFERMEPLSFHRKRVLDCMFAWDRRKTTYFNPPPETPLAGAMRDYLERLFAKGEKAGYAGYALLIPAAGLITFGRLDMAEFVLSHSPKEPIRLDHGAGWCVALPYVIVAAFLPVPYDLRRPGSKNTVDWVAGSPEGIAVQDWFASNKHRLIWNADAERFILS